MFVDMAARRAGPGRIPGIYTYHRNALPQCFVFRKRPELAKRPAGKRGTPGAGNRDPHADARQVFEGKRLLRVFRLCHKLLADAVVNVLGKPGLFPGKPFQLPFCRCAARGLEFGPEPTVSVTDVVDHA